MKEKEREKDRKTFPRGRYKQAVRKGKVEGMCGESILPVSGKIDPIDVVILQEIS